MARSIILLIAILILVAFTPTSNAGMAFMANNPNQLNLKIPISIASIIDKEIEIPLFGHVGFGYQNDDGTFLFGSFGPSIGMKPGGGLDWNINDPLAPVFAPGLLDIKNLKDMQAVKQYLSANGYRTFKIFNVDDPNPQKALNTMVTLEDSYYYLLTNIPVQIKGSNSENCLTFAKKVLEAYGVTNLPAIIYPRNDAPNNYYINIPVEVSYPDLLDDTPSSSASGQQTAENWYTEPQTAEGWYNKGTMLASWGRYDAAIQYFDNAIELNPYYVQAWGNKLWSMLMKASGQRSDIDWYNEGTILASQGRYNEAIQAYDTAIELNPDNEKAWCNKGAVLGKQGMYDEAIQALDKAIKIDPNYATAWYSKGATLGLQGKYDEAIQAFDKTIELNPQYVEFYDKKSTVLAYAWDKKGTALHQLGRQLEADAAHAKAKELGYAG